MESTLHRIPPLRRALLHVVQAGWIVRERHFQPFVFIHINKNGGRSIDQALGVRYEHKTAQEKRAELGAAYWQDKFTFAFVRNPWDRAVSQYAYRVKTNQNGLGDCHLDFKAWVRHVFVEQDPTYYDKPKLFLPQTAWLTDETGQIIVDFVGRFEHLGEDFAYICQQTGRSAHLPHANRSRRGDYRTYYDAATATIIARYFAEDLERFAYTFEP